MNQPKVSVIVPVLNTEPYLRQCLDSLVAQTLPETEVICIDNGSTDGSYKLLQEYASSHRNMSVLQYTAGRQGGARNFGIQHATGKYIGFVDSDDFVSPKMFERMYDVATSSRSDIVVCNINYYYGDDTPIKPAINPQLLLNDSEFTIFERPKLLRNLTICNKLISRDILSAFSIRFPEGTYHEDQFFVIVAFVLAKRIVSVSESLYFYRRLRPGSVNEYHGQDHLQIFDVMEMISKFIEEMQLVPEYISLFDEIKVSRILLVSNLIHGNKKRTYFQKMQQIFRQISISKPPQILTSTEYREYQIVRRSGHNLHTFFIVLQRIYAMLLAFTKVPNGQ